MSEIEPLVETNRGGQFTAPGGSSQPSQDSQRGLPSRLLDDFEGDPLATEHELLLDEHFAESLGKLEPSWSAMRSTLLDLLKTFDEAGMLRPRFRVRFPAYYAQYDYDRQFIRDEQHSSEWAEFDAMRDALWTRREWYEDPVATHPLQRNEVLAPYLERSADGPVDWKAWTRTVGHYEVRPGQQRPIERTFARSYYAEWQRLRAWALIERQTLRVLLDPRRLPAEQLWKNRNYDLTGSWLRSQLGDGRYARLLDLLEADGWLTALYRSRALIEWAELRTRESRYHVNAAEQALTVDERWAIERDRLVKRAATLAAPWNRSADATDGWPRSGHADSNGTIPSAFRQRVRALLDLWGKATEDGHGALGAVLRDDIASASEWAIFAFNTTFVANDAQVGSVGLSRDVSLGTVLQPERTQSLKTVRSHVLYLTEAFNREISMPQLDSGDFELFLSFLDENELWAWTTELTRVLSSHDGPPDTRRDREFLHLRSLALLHEQVLVLLASEFGTDVDRARVARSGAEALKTFLADRRDWRNDLWQTVARSAHLTRTDDAVQPRAPWSVADRPVERLSHCLRAIHVLDVAPIYSGVAKQILTLLAFRNFGAHRFSRDVQLFHEFGPHLRGAVIFCPLFYWKVATTLG